MKTDVYTKCVLTVIAVCLAILVLRGINIFPDAKASDMPDISLNPDNIKTNWDGSVSVRIVGVDNVTVPVALKEVKSTVPVEVKGGKVNTVSSGTVDVNVKNSYITTKPY